jgi:membrane-bound serine protease (ClpP class)
MNLKRLFPPLFLVLMGLVLLVNADRVFSDKKAEDSRPLVIVVDVDGSINPASASYIEKGIKTAEEKHAAALVIRLDTPGGVLTTTKTIVKAMINAKVPVIVYVAPSGSSASSAGALITFCADVAAMAPGTNIGAAHPVTGAGQDISGTMSEKVLNDITAYIRGIVTEKGRNAKWVESTIRESVSATAEEALELNAIDVVAPSLPDLLNKIDGRKIKKLGKVITLKTKNARVEKLRAGLRFKILDAVANPNAAYLLLMAGLLGLMVEFYNPGLIFPGVAGAICLLLGFYAMQQLPVNYVGVMLILLAIVLFILEVKITSFGLLSIGGITCLVLGSVMLFGSGDSAARVSWSVILPTVGVVSTMFIVVMGLAVKAQMRKPQTGEIGLVGEVGVAVTDVADGGKVFVHGEYWNARSDTLIPRGERIRVIRVESLHMVVTRD